jgi:hypothetical protein
VSRSLACLALGLAAATAAPAQARFSFSFPAAVHAEAITGRVFLILSHDSTPDPRIGVHPFERGLPLFGMDVTRRRAERIRRAGSTKRADSSSERRELKPQIDPRLHAVLGPLGE